jgi:hypothetical protein
VVVLLHKHFSSWLSIFCNYISIITNCAYANVSKSNNMTYVNNLFPFSGQLIMSNFPSVLLVLCLFFTYIALGDVDVCSSLILITKAVLLERELHQLRFITKVISPHMLLMAWQWHYFLLASNTTTQDKCNHGSSSPNHIKLKNIAYHLCQTASDWKLSYKSEKQCKFSSRKETAWNEICLYV